MGGCVPGPAAWSRRNEMTYLPNPLSSLTTVSCPVLTTRQKAEPSRVAVPRPSHRPAPTLSGSRVTSHSSPATKHKLTIWIYGFSRNDRGRPAQYAIGPTSFSTSAISTMTMASHGQPSRKQPSGPLLRHFLHPMHWMGSIWMRPNGGLSSSGTQNMQSSTGQYSTQAGDPAQPVQHSVITASSFGFFLRAVEIPLERGSCFNSSGTNPGALTTSGALAISRDFTLSVKPLPAWFFRRSRACYNARAIRFIFDRTYVHQAIRQTSRTGFVGRTRVAPLLHLAFPFLFRGHSLLRRACPQLAVPRRLRLLLPRAASSFGCPRPRLSRIPRGDLFPGWYQPEGRHARASLRRSCYLCLGRGHRRSSGRGRFRRDPQPCCHGCALAHWPLPLHRQLPRRSADGSSGNVLLHARTSDFSVARGNDARPHCLEPRCAPRRRKLVLGRARCWSRHTRPAGNAAASWSRADRALVPLSPSCKLEKTRGRNAVHDRWFAAAIGAVGSAQCRASWARAIPRPSLRGNIRRCPADRFLRLDKDLDVSFSGRVSFHLETALAADRLEKSSIVRSGFSRRTVARRFPAGSLQSNGRNDALARTRVRRVGAGAHTASSHPQLGLDSDRARRGDVVHSADRAAAVLRETLADERKLSQQSHRLRSYSRLRAPQCSVCCYGSCSRLVFAHQPRNPADRGVYPHSHGISHSTANLRTALRLGLLPRAAGHGRATFPRSANRLETIPAAESYFTFTLTSIFPFATICTLSPVAMYSCSTSGSAHSKSQPSSMAISVYRPGTTKFSANVPSESAWSRRNNAGLLFKSSGARTIIAPGAGLSFLSAIPVIFALPLAAMMVTFTSCAVAI